MWLTVVVFVKRIQYMLIEKSQAQQRQKFDLVDFNKSICMACGHTQRSFSSTEKAIQKFKGKHSVSNYRIKQMYGMRLYFYFFLQIKYEYVKFKLCEEKSNQKPTQTYFLPLYIVWILL